MFENTLNAMENPIKTIKGIGKALTIKTGKAIYASVKDVVINDIINGNTNTRSKLAGKAVLELGVSIIGAKALDKTLKAGKFSGAGRLSNYVDEIGRYSDDVSRYSDDIIKGKGKVVQNRSYKSGTRMADNQLLNQRTNTRGTQNLTEWRRSLSKDNIMNERIKFVGEDAVKIDKGTWRSLDGTRQFRTVPNDYLGKHGIGDPLVPNTPNVHFEFLSPPNPGGKNLKVIKNIHVPIK